MKSSEIIAVLRYIEQSNQAGKSKDQRVAELIERLSEREHDREIFELESRLSSVEDSTQKVFERDSNIQAISTELAVLAEKVDAQNRQIAKRPNLSEIEQHFSSKTSTRATVASAIVAAIALGVSIVSLTI